MSNAGGPSCERSHIDTAIFLVRRQGLLAAEVPVEASFLPGGSIGVVVLVTSGDGRQWVVKQVPGSRPSMLPAEAEGLQALGASATVAGPFVCYVGGDSLIMDALGPAPEDSPAFWQRLGEDIAALQASTRAEQHGWSHDNWLGGLPQRNTWDADGHRFFAEHRVQRFLEEPKVRHALSAGDVKAVERFCQRLPDLIPPAAPVLLHGDLWRDNGLAGPTGRPALIDPAVWYGWPEVDISMLWLSPRPAASARFFETWEAIVRPEPGWKSRAPLLHVREMLSVLAQFGDDNGTADRLRAVLTPFRPPAARVSTSFVTKRSWTPSFSSPQAPLGPHRQEEPVSYPQLLTPEEKLAGAKKLLSLPRIVVICGSTRFMTEMNEADLRETKAGKIVVKPGCDMKSPHELWSDPVEAEALKVGLDDLPRAKTRRVDEVLVAGDYIGNSPRAEIAYARSLGKPVRLTHPEVDPDA